MLRGFIFALLACFCWAIVFLIPLFPSFTAIEIILFRYGMYALISFIVFCCNKPSILKNKLTKELWIAAFFAALIGNVLYYLSIVIGMRLSSGALTVVVTGLSPILIGLYGNWHVKGCSSFFDWLLPGIVIFIGLLIINGKDLFHHFYQDNLVTYFVGVLSALFGLFSWSWVVVFNARLLRKNPSITASDWAITVGLANSVCVILVMLVALAISPSLLRFNFVFSSSGMLFLIWIVLLGVFSSWIATIFWNAASLYLPFSLMGPIMALETIFGLAFVYVSERIKPSRVEIAGIICILLGLLLSAWFNKKHKNLQPP